VICGRAPQDGTYGLLRFCLPSSRPPRRQRALDVALAWWNRVRRARGHGPAGVKKLVAYSSVSHMGLVVLGIYVFTIQGLQVRCSRC